MRARQRFPGCRRERAGPVTTDAERTRWQQNAVSTLTDLLKLQAGHGLPPCTWTITPEGTITAHCPGHPAARRVKDFDAWVKSLGQPDDHRGGRPEEQLRLRATWYDWAKTGVRIVLIADIPDGKEDADDD